MSSAEARYLKINFSEILDALKEYASTKAKKHAVKAIVLTGSLARGDYTGTSDADVLIIADHVPDRALERYAPFAEPSLPIDLQPHVYTTNEFTRRAHEGDRFALETLQFGIPLNGAEFFRQLKDSITNAPRA